MSPWASTAETSRSFSDGKRRMFHTRGWKWVVLPLLALGLAACLIAMGNKKLEEGTLIRLILAEPEPIEKEGLIFAKTEEQQGQTICTVVCFNPETLEETVVSTFRFDSAEDTENRYYFHGGGMAREAFSGDYSRMAVTKCYKGTAERHAGWIDRKGRFFDVTRKLGPMARRGCRGPAGFYALGFAGRWFGYYQHDPDSAGYMDFYVPVDIVRWGAVQGSTFKVYQSSGAVYEPGDVTVWLQTMRRQITGDPDMFPDGWDLVRSPDGAQIAYMSCPEPDGGADWDVYIASQNGGEPVKLTGYSFSLGEDGFTLIDWR